MTSTPSTPLRDRCRPISWRPGGALAALRLCGYAARGPTNGRRAPWVKRTLRQQAEAEATASGLPHPHLHACMPFLHSAHLLFRDAAARLVLWQTTHPANLPASAGKFGALTKRKLGP